MKKVFKDYLEVFIGSRGLIEGVSIKSFENIEDYLEFKSKENLEWVEDEEFEDEDYKKEVLGYWDWGKDVNGDYYLGLGDEEVKMYFDVKCEKFIKWKEKNNVDLEYFIGSIEDNVIRELLDM